MKVLIASIVLSLASPALASPAKHPESPAVAAAQSQVDAAKAKLKDAKKAAREALKERAKHAVANLVDSDGSELPDVEDVCRAIARQGETWEDACRRVTRGKAPVSDIAARVEADLTPEERDERAY